MNLRVKFFLLDILLCLTLGAAVVAAIATFQAFHYFQQQQALTVASDVRTIRPWMTVPYIAHVYHVPEDYLYQSLQIRDAQLARHVTLHALASRSKHPVNEVIHTVQNAIQVYRRQHHRQKAGVSYFFTRDMAVVLFAYPRGSADR